MDIRLKIKYVLLFGLLVALQSCASFQPEKEKQLINQMLNDWHLAAATADEISFFGKYIEGGIYIGTDPAEHWTTEELQEWSKEYFERESAWDFKPKERNIYFSRTQKTAWFDELLDTWMGTCRGSGVLEKVNGKWKITHYHLSVAVPNEKMKEYIELLEKP